MKTAKSLVSRDYEVNPILFMLWSYHHWARQIMFTKEQIKAQDRRKAARHAAR